MTRKTKEYLDARVNDLEARKRSFSQEADVGHQRAELHDNQAGYQAKNAVEAELGRIGDLRDAVIIEPERRVDVVRLGNRVKIKYTEPADQEGEVSALYLSKDDQTYAARTGLGDVITPESPVGQKIKGQSVSDILHSIGSRLATRFKLTNIEPGDFEE